jgi:hypothetical protein
MPAKIGAMDVQLTDLWYFARPTLVRRYFKRLLDGSGRLALFGPRRTGKTSLICRELLPLAEQRGMLPVYCDCWQDRSDPIGSINFALSSAMEHLEVPTSKVRRTLATEVTKLGAAGFSIEFGPEPKGRPPESPFFRVDWLLGALIARARRPVFLVIDEVQGLAEHREGDRIAGALRTALTRHEQAVRVLFTGSSETQLIKLFAQARATLYQFAASQAYELLDGDFVAHVSQRFKRATTRMLDTRRGLEILQLLGHQPEAFLSVVQVPLARADHSLDDGLEGLLAPDARGPWAQHWRQSTPLQQAVLVAVHRTLQLTSAAGQQAISRLLGKRSVNASSIRRATTALYERGLIDRSTLSSKALYQLTDPVFSLWVARHGLSLLSEPMQRR